jgi:hypothetical protein
MRLFSLTPTILLFQWSHDASPFYSSPDYSKTYKTLKPDLWVRIYKTCIEEKP